MWHAARQSFRSGLNAPSRVTAGSAAAPVANNQRAQRRPVEPTQYPSDLIALVVLWRLRYKLSLRDLPEMFVIRGIVFSHEPVREWEAKLTPALAEHLRRRRRGKAGRSWYVDETYLSLETNGDCQAVLSDPAALPGALA